MLLSTGVPAGVPAHPAVAGVNGCRILRCLRCRDPRRLRRRRCLHLHLVLNQFSRRFARRSRSSPSSPRWSIRFRIGRSRKTRQAGRASAWAPEPAERPLAGRDPGSASGPAGTAVAVPVQGAGRSSRPSPAIWRFPSMLLRKSFGASRSVSPSGLEWTVVWNGTPFSPKSRIGITPRSSTKSCAPFVSYQPEPLMGVGFEAPPPSPSPFPARTAPKRCTYYRSPPRP